MNQQAKLLMASGYLPAAEAARRAAVGYDTLKRWIAEGELPAERLGRFWYVKAANLVSKITGGEEEGDAAKVLRERIMEGLPAPGEASPA